MVVTQQPHDHVALGIYLAEFTFWAGIFACGGYYRFFPWLLSKSSLLRRIKHRASSTHRHNHAHNDSQDLASVAATRTQHGNHDGHAETPAQLHGPVPSLATAVDTAVTGTEATSVVAVTSCAAMADGSPRPNGGASIEGVGEEMMTLSVFRTASSATTDTAGSRRRQRQSAAGASMAVDDDVV